jgi:5-methylcytosine-specific restriction endonuclease McrA
MSDDRFEDYPIPAPPYSDADDNTTRTGPWWDWYRGYIKSPQWAARRDALLAQADWVCTDCKAHKATDAHHRTYQRAGCEPLSDLEALCSVCHGERHGIFSADLGVLAAEALSALSRNDAEGSVKRAVLN